MDILTPIDQTFIQLLALSTSAYLVRSCIRRLSQGPVEPLIPDKQAERTTNAKQISPAQTRSIAKSLLESSKHCMVFFGSQTGTAERLACQFAKEAQAKFGISCLVADLSDYDYDDLLSLEDQVAVFFLATYGEGEATDNGIAFKRYLDALKVSPHKGLSNLRYTGFGLGNSSYQYYNEMIQCLDAALAPQSKHRISSIGLGDEGRGSLDDDYISWKQGALPALAREFNLAERPSIYEPSFLVSRTIHPTDRNTFCGEPNNRHLRNNMRGPYTLANPFASTVIAARELCPSSQRQFLHLDLDISTSTLCYDVGDHLTIRPANSNLEVDRFLHTFGWIPTRDFQVNISSTDPAIRVPVPSPTTLDALVRYYLDICGPVSRQLLLYLIPFAPNDLARSRLQRLATNSDVFRPEVGNCKLNLAQVLQYSSNAASWDSVPCSLLLENIPLMKVRYYSISSSPLVARDKLSITTVVESNLVHGISFKGVATNYLLDLAKAKSEASVHDTTWTPTHQTTGPRQRYVSPTAFITIRHSSFKLPRDASIPIIMIGPGTGVAPFRGFVQSRSAQFHTCKFVGSTLLFYGCRRHDEDFLYSNEWEQYLQSPGFNKVFKMYTAFSREANQPKTYVQDLFRTAAVAAELRSLIIQKGAYVYVCGDARRMAADVWRAMVDVLCADAKFGEDAGEAERYLASMKVTRRWMEDVW